MAIIDYVKGELVTPDGKKVKRVTEGTGDAVPTGPISTGDGQFFAPGFGSNQTLDYEYYANDLPPAPPAPPAPPPPQPPQDQSGNPSQGNSGDVKNDDKTGAGAVPSLGDWAEAIMHGTTVIGAGGPIKAVVGQVAGELDFGDDLNNPTQIDPTGWDEAVKRATGSLPPGSNPAQVNALAAKIYKEAHPNWGKEPGGGSDDKSPANNTSTPGEAKANMGTPGMGGMTGDTISQEDMDAITTAGVSKPTAPKSPTVTTASGPKPSNTGGGGSGFGRAGQNFGSGTTPGSGADPNKGDKGGGHGSGAQPGKPDTAGSTAGGEKANPGNTHFAQGGYVSEADYGVPSSMRQMYRRPAPAQAPATQQKPNGNGGYNHGGHVTQAAKPIPARTQRYMQSRATGGFVAAQGFADGGVVPNQGYQDGGAVADDRFNPSPAAIADDGVVDNQPINADEGEYVIQRESAEILGPEILNALNVPVMAKAFSDLFDAALGLDVDTATDGVSPTPALPPTAPKKIGAPVGASLANDNGPGEPMPAFRKGGYVGKRC